MIITDGVHLVSTDNEDELHHFAVNVLRFKREWYQHHSDHPHYDLTTPGAALRATNAGAVLVTRRELLNKAWWRSA